jgi:hypothetical protein
VRDSSRRRNAGQSWRLAQNAKNSHRLQPPGSTAIGTKGRRSLGGRHPRMRDPGLLSGNAFGDPTQGGAEGSVFPTVSATILDVGSPIGLALLARSRMTDTSYRQAIFVTPSPLPAPSCRRRPAPIHVSARVRPGEWIPASAGMTLSSGPRVDTFAEGYHMAKASQCLVCNSPTATCLVRVACSLGVGPSSATSSRDVAPPCGCFLAIAL